MVFILIKRETPQEQIEWWEIDEESKPLLENFSSNEIKLYNRSGSYNYLLKSDTVLEVVEGKDWSKLNALKYRKQSSFYKELKENSTNKELKCGWVSPEGKIHYCDYREHISYVHMILGTDVPTIEKQGWVHLLKGNDGKPFYYSEHRITQEQAISLREIGVHVFDEEIIYQ